MLIFIQERERERREKEREREKGEEKDEQTSWGGWCHRGRSFERKSGDKTEGEKGKKKGGDKKRQKMLIKNINGCLFITSIYIF